MDAASSLEEGKITSLKEESEGNTRFLLLMEEKILWFESIGLHVLFLLLNVELSAGSRKFLLIKQFSLFFIVSCCS